MEAPSITFASLAETKQSVCLAFSEAKSSFSPALKALDGQAGGLIARAAQIAKFTGAKKTGLDLIAPAGLDLERLIVMGLGTAEKLSEADWVALGGRVRARLAGARVSTADIVLEGGAPGTISGRQAALMALGFLLRGYEFKKYKTKKKENDEEEPEFKRNKVCAHPHCAARGGQGAFRGFFPARGRRDAGARPC